MDGIAAKLRRYGVVHSGEGLKSAPMVSYPIELTEEQDGTFRVVAPHFPELATFGDTADDALMHAAFALEEVIAEMFTNDRSASPEPSPGVVAVRAD